MIQSSHEKLLRWAEWTAGGKALASLGVGESVLARIFEGKGEILPGAPYKTLGKIYHDPASVRVEGFVRTLGKNEKQLLKVFYLYPINVASAKAEKLKLPQRTMYDKLHGIHIQLEEYWRKK